MDYQNHQGLLCAILQAGFGGGSQPEELWGEGAYPAILHTPLPQETVALSKAAAQLRAPWVWASLLHQTQQGSVPAIKLYFELCRSSVPLLEGVGQDAEVGLLRQEIFGEETKGEA